MKLISCTIDNFGKLHNYHCRFDPDLHVTAEENGWGKTTLAAFLLAMFYGLEGDSRRKDSQRSRYQPWNGGACGGRLVFETGDGRFRAERTFGTKPRQDTFTLYDERTGLISDRYAADLGREIFGIDRESFCNTVFTSGSAGDTAPTAGIQARIRTPLPDADDLSDYEAALRILDRQRRSLGTGRSSGRIHRLEEEFSRLSGTAARQAALEEEYRLLLEEIQEQKRNTAALQVRREELTASLRVTDTVPLPDPAAAPDAASAPVSVTDIPGRLLPALTLFCLFLLLLCMIPVIQGDLLFLLPAAGAAAAVCIAYSLSRNRQAPPFPVPSREEQTGDPRNDLLRQTGGELRSVSLQLEDLAAASAACLLRLQSLQQELDRSVRARDRCADIEEELARLRRQERILRLAGSHLQSARDRFLSEIRDPFLRAFTRYYTELSGEEAPCFETDADLRILIRAGGQLRTTEVLSSGNRDLAGLAQRFAMLDAMYPSEKPFLVLDDPFVSMDDDRLRSCLQAIRVLSCRFQILYFTCHSSRIP